MPPPHRDHARRHLPAAEGGGGVHVQGRDQRVSGAAGPAAEGGRVAEDPRASRGECGARAGPPGAPARRVAPRRAGQRQAGPQAPAQPRGHRTPVHRAARAPDPPAARGFHGRAAAAAARLPHAPRRYGDQAWHSRDDP